MSCIGCACIGRVSGVSGTGTAGFGPNRRFAAAQRDVGNGDESGLSADAARVHFRARGKTRSLSADMTVTQADQDLSSNENGFDQVPVQQSVENG